jgi:hypothetical protein
VYIFMVDAGCIMASAFCANSVSPRVNETMIAPHVPLLVWVASMEPTASDRAFAPFVALHIVPELAGFRADVGVTEDDRFDERFGRGRTACGPSAVVAAAI